MLKKYKNDFIDIIIEFGLSPSDFKVQEYVDDDHADIEIPIFRLSFRDTSLWFEARNEADSFHSFDCTFTTFALNFPQSKYYPEENYAPINVIYNYFRGWLKNHVIEYLDEQLLPDLWAQIESERPLVTGEKIKDDEMLEFSDEEKMQLRLSINEFKHLIIHNFSPDDGEMQIVEDRLNYMCDALERLNRFDWRGIALSSLISISIALSLDTQKGRLLYELFKQVFSAALKFLQ